MKVLALVEAADHPCYRYRIEALAWAAAERGMYVEAMPLGRGLGRLRSIRAARRADVVILQRKLLPIGQLLLLRRNSRRLVYDFDDAQFQRDSYSRKGPESWSRTARFWATVYAADAVIAGNDYLAEAARAYASPEQVHVVPTCVDPGHYRVANHNRRDAAARLVWIGQGSTLPSLRAAEVQLSAAAKRLPGIELRLICDCPIELDSLRVEARRWSTATEADELTGGDIGVSWLPDDTWSRGKCGLRVLQFMAAGLPVVANPVGMNREMMVDGETGLLASTPGEWAEAVARLAGDPALRGRMGAAGRRLVEERFAVDGWGPRFAEVLAEVGGCAATLRRGRLQFMSTAKVESLSSLQIASLLRGLPPAANPLHFCMPRRLCISLLLLMAGCTSLRQVPLTLPGQYSLFREQLRIYSDFPLASHHRLIEDLGARRLDVERRLGLPVSDEPVYVYLFESAERFRAFMLLHHPAFPNRRAFFVETDTRLMVYAHWGDRVGEDLRHEVTHAYLHSVVPGIPLWLDEGLAETFEVARGKQGVNRPHLDRLSLALEKRTWQPELDRMEQLDEALELSQDEYAEAWAWIHFLLHSRPENAALLQAYLDELRSEGSTTRLSTRFKELSIDPGPLLVGYVRELARGPKRR